MKNYEKLYYFQEINTITIVIIQRGHTWLSNFSNWCPKYPFIILYLYYFPDNIRVTHLQFICFLTFCSRYSLCGLILMWYHIWDFDFWYLWFFILFLVFFTIFISISKSNSGSSIRYENDWQVAKIKKNKTTSHLTLPKPVLQCLKSHNFTTFSLS